MKTLENRLKKRINALVVIVRDIEKNQTKPTNAMLLSLFGENLKQGEKEAPELVERKFIDTRSVEKAMEVTTVPKIRHERLEDNMNLVKQDLAYVLERFKSVKSGFGNGHLK